jgi:hypothetical protein
MAEFSCQEALAEIDANISEVSSFMIMLKFDVRRAEKMVIVASLSKACHVCIVCGLALDEPAKQHYSTVPHIASASNSCMNSIKHIKVYIKRSSLILCCKQ